MRYVRNFVKYLATAFRTWLWRLVWNWRGRELDVAVSGGRSIRGFEAEILNITEACMRGALQFEPPDVLLDLGCAGGLFTQRLAISVAETWGVDASPAMIQAAQKNFMTKNLHFLVADGQKLPFAEATFSKILCYAVLIYLPSPAAIQECLSEMHRVAKPGARIFLGELLDRRKRRALGGFRKIFSINNHDFWSSLREALGHRLGMVEWLDPAWFQQVAEEIGFAVEFLEEPPELQHAHIMFDAVLHVRK
jgi:ubiquinone/menaquinone biosynthesis C-methylase UbiE